MMKEIKRNLYNVFVALPFILLFTIPVVTVLTTAMEFCDLIQSGLRKIDNCLIRYMHLFPKWKIKEEESE